MRAPLRFFADVRIKRALVLAGLVLVAIGFVADVNFVKGLGIGVFIVGFVAAGGA
jgi:hypothetical protein